MKVGFIGVGAMGMGIMSNLVNKGFSTCVFDRSASALAMAKRAGAIIAGSAAKAAEDANAVATMLPTAEVVEQIYIGAGGLIESLQPGQICIDFSTIDPGTAIRIAEKLASVGVGFIDSPVSGGGPAADAGTLTLMVGGDRLAIERVRSLLDAVATNVRIVGPNGAGSAAKLANNIIAASSMFATAEAYQLATNYGVSPGDFTQILETSSGNTWVLHNMHPYPGIRSGSPSSNNYKPGFRTDLMVEMLDLVCLAGREKGIELTIPPALHALWERAVAAGYAARDCTSVYDLIGPESRKDLREAGGAAK